MVGTDESQDAAQNSEAPQARSARKKLRRKLNHRTAWKESDLVKLVEVHAAIGNRWASLARALNRTDAQCKVRAVDITR